MTYTSDNFATETALSFAFRGTDSEAQMTRRSRRETRRNRRWTSCGF